MKTPPTLPLADTTSVWAKTANRPRRKELSSVQRADACIVGAGIAGLTTGYLLAKSGARVVVVDDGPIGGGMTEVTSAHLSDTIDDRFTEIEKWHGEQGSRLAAESHNAAINQIDAIASELKIDCDFQRVDGYLFRAPEHDQNLLDDELAAARRAGLEARMVDRAPIDYDTGPAIRYPNQARFHPLKYLVGVAKAIEEMGGQIFENSHADHVEGGDHAKVQVGPHLVCAKSIIIATNSPINDMVAIHTKQAPYMTYVIGARVPKGAITDALYWDTLHAYHYVRIQPMRDSNGAENGGHDLLIVGAKTTRAGKLMTLRNGTHVWNRGRGSVSRLTMSRLPGLDR